jgi:hypothetical protein
MARISKNHVPVEPYFGEWCFHQYPTELSSVPLMTTVDLEPILVHWCLEQFAPELSAEPVTDDALQQLDYTYQQVEIQLMGWSLTLSPVELPSAIRQQHHRQQHHLQQPNQRE